MNELVITPAWSQYVEIPIHMSAPVKLDCILEQRMAAFRQNRERILTVRQEEK